MKVRPIILVLFLLLGRQTFAQNQNNSWFFGNKAAISFVNGSPQAQLTSQMTTIEGCASVSDPATGKTLFYTNGIQIWNSKNNIMPNGNGLLAGSATSATQGVIIVPYPTKKNLYYVFTIDETSNGAANGLRYSIIDLNLNNGLGDIVMNQKNILIQTNSTERMAIVKNAAENGYWLLIHERNNNCFKAYSISDTGINTNPISSNLGSVHSSIPQTNGDGTMGYMKFSSDGNTLAVAIFAANKIELFDFDKCTGTLSNAKSYATIDNPYGIEFSPNNTKLYFSLYYNAGLNGAIYQLDLAKSNPSPLLIGVSSSINNQSVGALQLGPDNKIYVAINSEAWLSAITQPDNSGAACGFVDQAIALPSIGVFPTTSILGLPSIVPDQITISQSTISQINSTRFCVGDATSFAIQGNKKFTTAIWDFGDPASGGNNSASSFTPQHVFSAAGNYNVSAIVTSACAIDTISSSVTITNCDSVVESCQLYFPNTFTPNGDGLNDQFNALTSCSFESYSMQIFNRWGEAIFQTSNPSDKWDGQQKGKDCPIGAYVYLITYKYPSQEPKVLYGSITLLR